MVTAGHGENWVFWLCRGGAVDCGVIDSSWLQIRNATTPPENPRPAPELLPMLGDIHCRYLRPVLGNTTVSSGAGHRFLPDLHLRLRVRVFECQKCRSIPSGFPDVLCHTLMSTAIGIQPYQPSINLYGGHRAIEPLFNMQVRASTLLHEISLIGISPRVPGT